jgi:hypothetical protein
MPVLGLGLLLRLQTEARWYYVDFDDLVACDDHLDWYSAIMMRFPHVSSAAQFVLTIPFTNTNVSSTTAS